MKEIKIVAVVKEYDSADELTPEEQSLIESSKNILKGAYAPYSHFKVGASVLLDNGVIVSGGNQENAAYPSGLCAERVAVFAASSQYPDSAVKAIAITASSDHFLVNTPVTPCGACRQVLVEYEVKFGKDIKVIMTGMSGKIYVVNNIQSLLPLVFDASKLKLHLIK